MTSRDGLMAVLEGKEPHRVVWQPRINHWYYVTNLTDTIPERYKGMYIDEVYEDIGAVPRQLWTGALFYGSGRQGYITLNAKEGNDVDCGD